MPNGKRIPSYCHHKPTGQAYVRLSGKQMYLGVYGSPESKAEYDRLISDWLRKNEVTSAVDLTVAELILHFWRYCKARYGNSGKGRFGSAVNWRPILRLINKRFGKRQVAKFGPKALKSLFDDMIEMGWSRRYINDQLNRGKQMFKWAASEELIQVEVYTRLATVDGLRRGQTKARETAPVRPVNEDIVDATIPFMPEVVADMVRFQRLTGARPAEVCILRPCDLDRSREDIWFYDPSSHKTEHHGKARRIYIGPKAQAVIRPYLLRAEQSFCFEPKRKSRGKKYSTDSYRRAIHRACEKQNQSLEDTRDESDDCQSTKPIPKWSPNQLRHAAGTAVRAEFDAETAQAILGHSNLKTTEIYAEKAEQRAIEAARKLG